jgi:hypothetical protein
MRYRTRHRSSSFGRILELTDEELSEEAVCRRQTAPVAVWPPCRCVAWLRVFMQSMQYPDPADRQCPTRLSSAVDCWRLLAYMHDFFVQVMEHGHRLHQTEKILSQFILTKVHYLSVHSDLIGHVGSNCCGAFARPSHVARRMTDVQSSSDSLMRTACGSVIISPAAVPAPHRRWVAAPPAVPTPPTAARGRALRWLPLQPPHRWSLAKRKI